MADLPAAHDELFGAVARADQGTSARHAAAQNHHSALTGRLTDAVKLVAAHFLRDEARAAAYFRTHLLHP